MDEKCIKTTTSHTMLGEDGIVRVRMIPGTRETLETARENIAAFLELSAGKKLPVLIDLTDTLGASREARRLYSGDDVSRYTAATAMVVTSPVTILTASFFLKLNQPRRILRLFASESEAIEWLRQYLP